VIFQWLLKGIAVLVFFLLHLFGWKHADSWLYRLAGANQKEEKQVV